MVFCRSKKMGNSFKVLITDSSVPEHRKSSRKPPGFVKKLSTYTLRSSVETGTRTPVLHHGRLTTILYGESGNVMRGRESNPSPLLTNMDDLTIIPMGTSVRTLWASVSLASVLVHTAAATGIKIKITSISGDSNGALRNVPSRLGTGNRPFVFSET